MEHTWAYLTLLGVAAPFCTEGTWLPPVWILEFDVLLMKDCEGVVTGAVWYENTVFDVVGGKTCKGLIYQS